VVKSWTAYPLGITEARRTVDPDMQPAPHFGGGLRVAGDVRGDVQAANRASFALSL
jgi:hypothetical protein